MLIKDNIVSYNEESINQQNFIIAKLSLDISFKSTMVFSVR